MYVRAVAIAIFLIGTCSATATSFRGAFLVETSEGYGGLDSLGLKSTLDCTVESRLNFTSAHFSGDSFDVVCPGTRVIVTAELVLAQLSTITSVKHAWHLPQAKTLKLSPVVPTLLRRAALPDEEVKLVAPRASPLVTTPFKIQDAPEPFAPHVAIGVDRLHAAGLRGSGVRIAVIDSGFDLSVPGLANTRVAYTHDMTDGDSDVSDGCSFHGTHVLGTLGANSNGNNFGVVGAAPDATYELYRIAPCGEGSSVDVEIAAFLEAADRGVDVISCSFGGGMAFPEEPLSLVASRIEANGTFISLVSGNGGPGVFSNSAPGTPALISSVGSTDSPVTPYYTWRANLTDGSNIRFVPGSPFVFPDNQKLTVWWPGSAENLTSRCNPLPKGTKLPQDPANTILLIDYLHCWLDPEDPNTQITNKLGIPYTMYYQPTNYSGVNYGLLFLEFSSSENRTGLVTIPLTDARSLADKISRGAKVQVSIPTKPAESDMQVVYKTNNISGDLTSSFSSWGPTPDGRIMPSVLAPGGNIMSTFPGFLGNWGVVSGTSQATPLLAGVAALLIEKYPNLKPADIQALISSTAKPVKWNDGNGTTLNYLAPVFQQGAGLVDAWAAANVASLLNVSSLNFNDTANRPSKLAFSISNPSKETVKYTFAHTGAASGYILSGAGEYGFTGAEARPVYAKLAISPKSITLKPGTAADVVVSIAANPSLPESGTRGSFFGGYVTINSSSDSGRISIPYTGFGSALKSLPTINRNLTFSAAANESLVTTIEDNHVYNCLYNASITTGSPVNCSGGLNPGFKLTFLMLTRSYIFDIVHADNKTDVALTALTGGPNDLWTDGSYWYWDGTDGGGAFLPEGKYTWRVTALKSFGNAEKVEDFDVWYGNNWTMKFSAGSVFPQH